MTPEDMVEEIAALLEEAVEDYDGEEDKFMVMAQHLIDSGTLDEMRSLRAGGGLPVEWAQGVLAADPSRPVKFANGDGGSVTISNMLNTSNLITHQVDPKKFVDVSLGTS